MQLLAGVWAERGTNPPDEVGRWLLRHLGLGGTVAATSHPNVRLVAAGQCGHAASDRHAVTCAGRINNRADLLCRLSAASAARNLSDAELLLQLYSDRGPEALRLPIGAAAALLWDGVSRELIAWRAPGSERQIFVASRPGLILAASLPQSLFVHPELTRQLNFAAAAASAAQTFSPGQDSMFAGVTRVMPGQALSLSPEREPRELFRYAPTRKPRSFASIEEAATVLRATFDQAVADCLPEPGARTAALLSSGRDSSAVAASASLAIASRGRGERLLALTGAPSKGGRDRPTSGRMADEAELAGFTARQLGNVDHRVCRPPAGETLRTLSQIHASSVQPMGNLCNLPWFSATIQAAEEANATRLLQGTAGNLTISAGSREFLGDMAEEQGWRAALRTVPFSSGRSAHAWLNSLHVLAGPRLPRHLYLALARLADRYDPRYGQFPTLRPPYRAAAEQVLRDVSPHPGPGRSGFGWRLQLLFNHDHADLFHPSLFRVELRDPTNDPRVVDLMMGMPPQFLVPTPDEPRPLYAKAFGSRLPRAVVQGRTRGYQGADWDRQFPAAEVHARFVSLLRNPLVAELFDGRYLLETVLKRPREPAQLASWPVIRDHRMMLLAALSVADWVDVHFPA